MQLVARKIQNLLKKSKAYQPKRTKDFSLVKDGEGITALHKEEMNYKHSYVPQ